MKLTANTCFSLKSFKIFDKTIIDTKRLHKDKYRVIIIYIGW